MGGRKALDPGYIPHVVQYGEHRRDRKKLKKRTHVVLTTGRGVNVSVIGTCGSVMYEV